jgi:hypothetical protein
MVLNLILLISSFLGSGFKGLVGLWFLAAGHWQRLAEDAT